MLYDRHRFVIASSGECPATIRRHGRELPVDGHVHFHDRALVAVTLDSALANFDRVIPPVNGLRGILLLTQAADERVFEEFEAGGTAGAWSLRALADEPQTLIARKDEAALAIVCGRQVRASNGLEVLALGTRETFLDGMSLEDSLTAARATGAVTVLPWGFGKWIGARGELIRTVLRKYGPDVLFVGDNGSRLASVAAPILIREAAHEGFKVLPGTDPFPFGADYSRVGGFGFLADIDPSVCSPWRHLRDWLILCRESPTAFGTALTPTRFLFNQGWIQIHNRVKRRVVAR